MPCAIPDATLACLGDRRDLGIHTEMFSDGVLPLVQAEVINNSRKRKHRGRIVTTFVMGSQALYDFVDDNPEVVFLDVEYTNDTSVIALPATAAGGSVSRISAMLSPGAGVVTTRAHVHYIATEYGVANLRARSMNERASELIKVAAPQFQEQLAREALDTWGLHIKG